MQTFTRSLMKTGLILAGWVASLQGQQAGSLNLTGTVSGPTSVVLAWTGTSNAVRYYVQRSAGAAAFSNLGTPKITGTTYTDPSAPAGSVRYRVFANPAVPRTCTVTS